MEASEFRVCFNGIPDSHSMRSHGWHAHPVTADDVRCSHNYPRSRGRRRPQPMQPSAQPMQRMTSWTYATCLRSTDLPPIMGRSPLSLSIRAPSLRPRLSRRTRRRSSLNYFNSRKQVSDRFLTSSNSRKVLMCFNHERSHPAQSLFFAVPSMGRNSSSSKRCPGHFYWNFTVWLRAFHEKWMKIIPAHACTGYWSH